MAHIKQMHREGQFNGKCQMSYNKCPELTLHFPINVSELKGIAIEFQSKSSFKVLDDCICAFDRWRCQIKVTWGRDTSNIAFFIWVITGVMESLHYQCATKGAHSLTYLVEALGVYTSIQYRCNTSIT
jgi:hypothetical protein